MKSAMTSRTVLFVCRHGAGRSRLAAAFFNQAAPEGWLATSAGLEPDPVLSPTAAGLLAGTAAAPYLDAEAPRAIGAVTAPARTVAIECEVPGADSWELKEKQLNEAARDEIAERVAALADEVGRG